MTVFIHLSFVISVLSAQYEIQNYLDQFTDIAVGEVVDGIIYHRYCSSGIWLIWNLMVIGGAQQQFPVIGGGVILLWRWDHGIHMKYGLFQMMLITDKVEAVIGFHH
jgi:hypothetical protein